MKLKIAEKDAVANENTQTTTRMRASAALVEGAYVHPAAALAELKPLLRELDERAAAQTGLEQELTMADERVRSDLDHAEVAGENEPSLSRGQTVLERLVTDSPRLAAEAKRLEQERQELVEAAQLLAADDAKLESLRAAAVKKEQAEEAADEAVQQAAAVLQAARDELSEFRRLAADALRVASALGEIEIDQQEASEHLALAGSAEAQARDAATAAADAVAELQRQHAAVHAAEGLHPGDPCPICGHAVPPGFKPPRAPAEMTAKKAHERATAAESKARDDRARLEERSRQLGEAVTAAREKSKTASAVERTALRRLRKVLGDAQADPSIADEQLLTTLASRVRRDKEALKLAKGQAQEARLAATSAEAVLKPREAALAERRSNLDRDEASHTSQATSLEVERVGLPDRFRPAANTSLKQMETLLARVKARLAEVGGLRVERERLESRFAELRADKEELANRRRLEFDAPRLRAERAVLLLHERLRDATRLAELETPLLPEGGDDFASYAAAVATLEGDANNIMKTMEGRASDADKVADKARADILGLLEKADATSAAELNERLIAAAAARQAKAEEDLARAQVRSVAALEKKLGPLRTAIGTLEALASELTDSRFIGFVVTHRQRALLGVASQVLGSMTGDRYGFAEDFKIIDRTSGQPRGARTLSGGETFLASLALALGLVELAARSGGRLEALFLDEGFGTLDADALQEALGELERCAASGRLVAVISHLRAVAEEIETVLRVTYRPEGSEVLTVSGAEREAFVTEEIEQGLLA